MNQVRWGYLTTPDRVEWVKSLGLPGTMGSMNFTKLPPEALAKINEATTPKEEPVMAVPSTQVILPPETIGVHPGHQVTLTEMETGEKMTFSLVRTPGGLVKEKILGTETPLAKALLGKMPGQTVVVKTKDGKTISFKVDFAKTMDVETRDRLEKTVTETEALAEKESRERKLRLSKG